MGKLEVGAPPTPAESREQPGNTAWIRAAWSFAVDSFVLPPRFPGSITAAEWMCQPGVPRAAGPATASVMGPGACSAQRTWLLTFSAFCLLLWPFANGMPVPTSPSWSQEPRGKVLVVQMEAWRRCGNVALDPKDSTWSCCGLHYPFHRGSQRCCSTHMKEFRIIPKDNSKSEYDDCREYNRKDL